MHITPKKQYLVITIDHANNIDELQQSELIENVILVKVHF